MGAARVDRRRRRRRPRRPLRHQQQGRLAEPAVSQPRRRHVRGHRRARSALADAEPARAPASRWAPSGATTTTTASRTCSLLPVGPAGAVPQRRRQGASRASASRAGLPPWANINTAVWLDYDRDGRLDLFLGGYFAEQREPLEARRHEDDAGELRVREQRRPQVPVSQPRRRALRGGQREGRPRRRGAGRWPRSPPTCAAPAIPISSSPTTTASRSCSSTRAARFREVGTRDRRRLRAQERHERVGRRRAEPGHVRRSTSRTSRRKASCSRATTCGCRPAARRQLPTYENLARVDGRRPRRLELRRAVRRPQQRRLPRPLPGQRLRLGVARARATGTTTRRSPAATRS